MMKTKNRGIVISLIFLISLLPLFLSLYVNIFNASFYSSEFSKYGVDDKYAKVDMNKYNWKVLDYLLGKSASMPTDIPLNAREISHMSDVRSVFRIFFIISLLLMALSIVLFIILYFDKKFLIPNLSIILKYSALIGLALSIVLALFFYFGFDSSFTVFHKLFFKGDSWLFDPADNIINIYPEGLFFDIALRIFFTSFFISGLVFLARFFLPKNTNKIYK